MQRENWTDRNWQLTLIFSAVCIVGGYVFLTVIFPQAKDFFFLSHEKKNILNQLKSRPNLTHEDFPHKFEVNEDVAASFHRGKVIRDGENKLLKERRVMKSLETPPPSQSVTAPSTITIPEKKPSKATDSTDGKTSTKDTKSSKSKSASKWSRYLEQSNNNITSSHGISTASFVDPAKSEAVLKAEQDREYEECLRKDLERQKVISKNSFSSLTC
jgi:hypothetical protein